MCDLTAKFEEIRPNSSGDTSTQSQVFKQIRFLMFTRIFLDFGIFVTVKAFIIRMI